VKYTDDLVLLSKDEVVLQGMIERLIEVGRCCGMEIIWKKLRCRESQGNHLQYKL